MANCDTVNGISDCTLSVSVPITVSPGTLSGYTRITEFTFTPNLTGDFLEKHHKELSQVKMVWDFGDGYTLSAADTYSATHTYNYPGNYTVSLYFYDNKGDALLNILTRELTIKNKVTTSLKFTREADKNILAGQFKEDNNKIEYSLTTTWQDYQSEGNTIYFAASGSYNAELFDFNYKYAHLLPFRTFYILNSDNNLQKIKNAVRVRLTPRHYVLNGENPIYVGSSPISGSKVLGYETKGSVYYYDDKPGAVKIYGAIDTSSHTIKDYFVNDISTNLNLAKINYAESNVAMVSANVVASRVGGLELKLTSTGLADMTLPATKRQGDKFRVFVNATLSSNATTVSNTNRDILKKQPLKFFNKFYYNNDGFDLGTAGRFKVEVKGPGDATGSTSSYISSVSSDEFPYNTSLSSSEIDSFFYFNFTPTVTGLHTISVSGKPYSSSPVISGQYTFTVLPSGGEELFKINEKNFDYAETLKSYRFQEFLYDYDSFFDGVLGSIVGTLSSGPNTLGKSLYEKISNFVVNNTDVDTCKVSVLKKLFSFLNEEYNFPVNAIPPELERIYDLISVKLKRLTGDREQYNTSVPGSSGQNVNYNLRILPEYYTVRKGNKFVAVQKFNNEHIIIDPQSIPGSHTYPTSASPVSAYPLSAYNINSDWGWGLDTSVSGASGLKQIYDFYSYIPGSSNKVRNSLLHSDSVTSVSATFNNPIGSLETEINKNIDYQLRKGLNL